MSETLMKNLTSLICLFALTIHVNAKHHEKNDPMKPDADYAIQGEYAGKVESGKQLGVQVIALGDHKFRAVGHVGGLPGDGWDGSDKEEIEAVQADDGTVTFKGQKNTGIIKSGKLEVYSDGEKVGVLDRVVRKSPTLGQKPPKGAVVLFDGTNVDAWAKGRLGEDGTLIPRADSKQKFQSHQLHLEFMTPYKPKARGQGRGNSGVYMQGRYETQVLDSFGLKGKMNEAGGIYSIKDPDLNMCFPPLTWQTYDVDFIAAKYEDGKLVAHPRMTVKLNGVVVQRDIELPKSTTAAPVKPGPEPGFLYLQDHGNPVRYRNIWVVEK